MNYSREQLLLALKQKLDTEIPLYSGAVCVSLPDGDVWLEFPENSALISIHCIIETYSKGAELTPTKMKQLLSLNSDSATLRGGWLGIHEVTHTIRYFWTIPLSLSSPDLIWNAINNIATTKALVIKKLAEQPAENVRDAMPPMGYALRAGLYQ